MIQDFEIVYTAAQIASMSLSQLQAAIEMREFLILCEHSEAFDAALRLPGDLLKKHLEFFLAHGSPTYRLLREEWDRRGGVWADPMEQEWPSVQLSAADIMRFAHSWIPQRFDPNNIDPLN